jgi:uncharacterized membrane protein YcaP (DUF421 family)
MARASRFAPGGAPSVRTARRCLTPPAAAAAAHCGTELRTSTPAMLALCRMRSLHFTTHAMPDFAELFSFSVPPVEVMARGTAVYWFLFCLFRFVLRRDTGSLAITDVLLVVLIADASANAMSGGYETVSDGFVLVTTIAGWNYALDWAAFRWGWLRKWVEGQPTVLVRNGRMLRRNMERELVTRNELRAALRAHGLEDLAQVKLAVMEPNGDISVINKEGGKEAQSEEKGTPVP